MANETATKSKRFYCVSLIPDICKTPIGPSTPPIPYSVVGEFAEATDVSPNVKSRSEPMILFGRSVIPTVKGDEAGKAGGIKSGTFGKCVETKTSSKTYGSNGTKTVQEGCEVWMNKRNTVGKIYERGGMAPRTRLQQIAALLGESIDEATAEAKEAVKSAAQHYKDNVSAPLHGFGRDAVDAGGKVAMGSAAVAGAGLAVGATGVGAPLAAAMEVGAAAGGAVGGSVAAVGGGADVVAKVLDRSADFVLTGKTPDLVAAAMDIGSSIAETAVMGKFRSMVGWASKKFPALDKLFKDKSGPGKKSDKPPPPRPPDKKPGGKTSKKKEEKGDKPSDCCPKDGAPGGKRTKTSKPVHLGTGEEILHQTDFVIDGPAPFAWTRCYRSGAELEDWGLCGARWATPFTSSLLVVGKGIVYVDDSGRAMRLPALAEGQSFDSRKEGFTLKRGSANTFMLTWRDGSVDTFEHDATTPGGWLPHGYDGVNAIRTPGTPVLAERFELRRSVGRDGRGVTIDRFAHAKPGELLLRVRSDDGIVIEAMRDGDVADQDSQAAPQPIPAPPRIGHIDEVRADGTRVCHVRYEYKMDAATAQATPIDAFDALPVRHDLVRQTNLLGHACRYTYQHHLLIAYTTYTGFAHHLTWSSFEALRERWGGNALAYTALLELFPITLSNSYRARVTSTSAEDGKNSVSIAYIDEDTTRLTEANGGILEYTFDANWLAVEVRRVVPGRAVLSSLGRRVWDKDGMLLVEIDAAGRRTQYRYDSAGNVVASTDALGHISQFEYDGANQLVAMTDALGHVTRFSYDGAGRLLTRTDALGHVTSYRYDKHGNLTELKDAKGGSKQFNYKSTGQLVGYTDCSGYRTEYQYDADNRLAGTIDETGQSVTYAYDALGRLTGVTQPDGTQEQFVYDVEGRLTIHIDAAGNRTRYSYNGHGLPTERVDAIGQTLQYRYDAALQLVELINASGEKYGLTYDEEGRLTSETGFDGKTTSYTYDSNGQLTAFDCRGQRTELMRDLLGRLLAKRTDDGICRYAYDSLGRLTAVAAPHAEQRFQYDALGQLVEERSAYYLAPAVAGFPGAAAIADVGLVMSHAYDELGNRIQTTLPNGRRIDTLRYGSGHWHGTLWQGASIVDIERDRLHRETNRRIGTGKQQLSATRSYDPQSRLQSLTLAHIGGDPEHAIRERRFSYDLSGNLTTIEHGWHTNNDTLGKFSYTYDPIGQLLTAVQPGLKETFAFDPASNLLDVPPVADSTIYDYEALQKTLAPLPPVTHNLLKAYAGYSYQYDGQGNVSNKHYASGSEHGKRDLDLTYDADNRLIAAVRRGYRTRHRARYLYDAFSRRIAKFVSEEVWSEKRSENVAPSKSCTATTLFVWDGDVMVQEVQESKTATYVYEPDSFLPLARIESSMGSSCLLKSDAAQTGDSIPRYVQLSHISHWDVSAARHRLELHDAHVEDLYRITWQRRQADAECAMRSDRVDYYNCDHLGTPRELVDRKGRVVWSARFKAWGQVINEDIHRVDQPLRFQGQYEDTETGLNYNRYRHYDPDAARYLTQDPIGLLGGLNSYAYASNPTGWKDPLGLAAKCSKNAACDPCAGKNPAAEAMSTQGTATDPNNPYSGVDSYANMVLKKGTILYSLYPGAAPGFSVMNHTLIKASSDTIRYHDLTQVTPGKDALGNARSMRTRVQVYRVSEDICVAKGIAKANGQFGNGGATQYYVSPSDAAKLSVGKIRSI